MKKLTKKEKVLFGVSVVSLGVAGYFGYKYLDVKKTMELLTKEKEDTNERLNFIEFLVIESECIPKALQNANNKLSRVQSKIEAATERLLKVPNDVDAQKWLENNKAEEAKLVEHITKAMKLDEAVKADQNIYAK
jgi:hypothetical protein